MGITQSRLQANASQATVHYQHQAGSLPEYGLLAFPRDYGCCWVVDGQHRLYAFAIVTKDIT